MTVYRYIDRKGALTNKYYEDKENIKLKLVKEVSDSVEGVVEIINSLYDSRTMQPEDMRSNGVELKTDSNKLSSLSPSCNKSRSGVMCLLYQRFSKGIFHSSFSTFKRSTKISRISSLI